MIDDLQLRWLVTGLCLLSGVGFALAADRRSPASVISHGLHLMMALAMAVMAWPQGLQLPATPAEVLFAAAAVWFVLTAVLNMRAVAQLVVRGYHALSMLAMSWMYAVVHHQPEPDAASTGHHHHHHHMPPDLTMPDMDMGAGAHTGGDWPGWIDAGNWIWALLFVLAAILWGYLFATQRRPRRRKSRRSTVDTAAQAMMAAGMAIMFGALLVPG